MSFKEKIKTAQRLTLRAAFELLHWDNDDAPQELSQCIMANANIRISGVPLSGKSHVGMIVREMPNYTTTKGTKIENGRIGESYILLNSGSTNLNNGEFIEFRLVHPTFPSEMEVFWQCINAMQYLIKAALLHKEANQ